MSRPCRRANQLRQHSGCSTHSVRYVEVSKTSRPAMLVLFETPAGFALFKVTDEKKVTSVEDVAKCFETAEGAKKA